MLENPTDSSSTATVKRYAPPNQRNRSLGRRKSGGDRLERASSYGNDGDKMQATALRNAHIDHADPPQLIGLQGCCSSEAYQLLNDRWAAAVKAYESSSSDAERPVMYSGSSVSAWGQFRLPHQMISPMGGVGVGVGPSGPKIDFISELKQAMHNSNAQF